MSNFFNTLRMAYFVISGKPDCSAFVHAAHVGMHLQENLPNFKVRIIQKWPGDWESWLSDKNQTYEWCHNSSPLIWKELAMRGSTPHYVGGLCEFWEYCFDYYSLQSIMSSEDLLNLVADNLQYQLHLKKDEEEKAQHIRQIGVIGTFNKMTQMILTELIEIPNLAKTGGVQIKVYDLEDRADDTQERFNEFVEDVENFTMNGELEVLQLVDRLSDVLGRCELLIITGDYCRRKEESEKEWLKRNMANMFVIADAVNVFAKRNLRIVVAIHGPVCFCVNVLVEACTTLKVYNIVGITSDAGLGCLKCTADQARIPLARLGAPPVWGFVGVNQFVDVRSSIICSDIYRPYQRMLKNKGGSTLPQGIIQPELRYAAYLLTDVDDIFKKAEQMTSTVEKKLGRRPIYSKLRALSSFLTLWYAQEPGDEIISLAVVSNGAHGIPRSLVFSQPVKLNKKGVWTPFKNFPVTKQARQEIAKLVPLTIETTDKMSMGPYGKDLSSISESGSNSYDFTN